MISVTRHWGNELHQARRIASEMQIPYKVLTQILANLVADGLLEAKHGPKGGYRLARPPSDITLLDVVESAEGPATFNHCVLRDGPCDWEETCPIHDTWSRAQDALALASLLQPRWLTSRASTPLSRPATINPTLQRIATAPNGTENATRTRPRHRSALPTAALGDGLLHDQQDPEVGAYSLKVPD